MNDSSLAVQILIFSFRSPRQTRHHKMRILTPQHKSISDKRHISKLTKNFTRPPRQRGQKHQMRRNPPMLFLPKLLHGMHPV